ncbi:ribonuclease III [Selenomonadales bacterium OttesenSCG-928-I06]|nr:ribonuclease III [Selenomonadales bacterium OttesenSCG-928-I06]
MNSNLDKSRVNSLKKLCASLNINLKNYELLHQALVHTSYANEVKNFSETHNERLEFLGDSILNLIISKFLFLEYSNLSEGELSFIRSQIVCESTLAKKASELNFGDYLLLGKGELLSGGRERVSILADTFEAIVGAVFLETDFETTTEYVLSLLKDEIHFSNDENSNFNKDYKSWLQEILQKDGYIKISYEVISEEGPAHNKSFEITVTARNTKLGTGSGKNKKEAEQRAAKEALTTLGILDKN